MEFFIKAKGENIKWALPVAYWGGWHKQIFGFNGFYGRLRSPPETVNMVLRLTVSVGAFRSRARWHPHPRPTTIPIHPQKARKKKKKIHWALTPFQIYCHQSHNIGIEWACEWLKANRFSTCHCCRHRLPMCAMYRGHIWTPSPILLNRLNGIVVNLPLFRLSK